jgi:hypothetical protein
VSEVRVLREIRPPPPYLSRHIRVSPCRLNHPHESLYDFLRRHFDDNNIYESYSCRRWVTYDGEVYFRSAEDAVLFTLLW